MKITVAEVSDKGKFWSVKSTEDKRYSYFKENRDKKSNPTMSVGKTYECDVKVTEDGDKHYNNILPETIKEMAGSESSSGVSHGGGKAYNVNTMLMSYAKDVVVARLMSGEKLADAMAEVCVGYVKLKTELEFSEGPKE